MEWSFAVILVLGILQYKNCEKNIGIKKKTNETFPARNRCSKELDENKKNMFYKYKISGLTFTLNIKCISNKKFPFI